MKNSSGDSVKSENTFIAIDLKSFYASVECVEREHNPLTTNLVVADPSRTEKTICLAVSPALKSFGVPGRPRLFEVIQKVKKINSERLKFSKEGEFTFSSYDLNDINSFSDCELDYIVAPPRMSLYIKYSTKIYSIYLKYFSKDDIHVYSIDEVFIDVTPYLKMYKTSAKNLASTIMKEIFEETGITSTCGIGTNLYLAKIAMDIMAKHAEEDKNGVRIAELDEKSFRQKLWNHRPLTDFWRIGNGLEKRLNDLNLFSMGDIARFSLEHSELLYKKFGINAELIIDHAWGVETATMKDIKAYKPRSSSLSTGQVLHCPYEAEKARLVVKEMAEELSFSLIQKRLLTNQIQLFIGYDKENLENDKTLAASIPAENLCMDPYGRLMPKPVHSLHNFLEYTSNLREITEAALEIFDRICDKRFTVRRFNITSAVISEEFKTKFSKNDEATLFDTEEDIKSRQIEKMQKEKENNLAKAVLDLKKKYGKNAVLKGMNLEEGAMQITRNKQIGGHSA